MSALIQLREPVPSFRVDRDRGEVVWEANGLRLLHAPQFRALADLFAENGWRRHYNALHDAELAVSEVIVRDMLRASLVSSAQNASAGVNTTSEGL